MFSVTNPGIVIGGNSPQLVLNAPNTCDGKYYLKLKVTNPLFEITRENVQVIDPSSCTICPDLRNTKISDIRQGLFLSITPNPAKDLVAINFQVPTLEEALIDIIDISGQIIFSKSIQPSGNLEELSADLRSFSSGLYVARITQASTFTTQLFTILR